MRQTKLASSMVNFRAQYKIVGLNFLLFIYRIRISCICFCVVPRKTLGSGTEVSQPPVQNYGQSSVYTQTVWLKFWCV